MKLIDFDGLFDEKLAVYMEENKEKYTEQQWEDVIPRLYKKFGDTYVAKVKCTPKEYYAKMTDAELTETLLAHLASDVPVPEFLCGEMESRGNAEMLLPLLDSDDAQTVSYAVNMLLSERKAYEKYFTMLQEGKLPEDVLDDVVDVLKADADFVCDRALELYRKGEATEYVLEILSRLKEKRSDEAYRILLNEFLQAEEKTPMRASYLAAYGDERALPVLLERIADETIGFVEFQELKYAIEALGGEYDEPRDFSWDSQYIAVEEAGAKALKTDEPKS
ncbi:MAG: hypothetical protein IJX81_04255 [Clostridia bacterium]|nr:hypothetical protein [Clostridia bacterium]